ncbi:hypothetical protein [Metamycoplasma hominis]
MSENYYQKLKTNKVLLEVFIVIKSLKNPSSNLLAKKFIHITILI